MSAALTLSLGETPPALGGEAGFARACARLGAALPMSLPLLWRLGESNPSRHWHRHSISPSSLVPPSCIRAAPAITARRKQRCP